MSGPGINTVHTALTQLCKQIEGLRSITVTDRDGVVVLRAPDAIVDEDKAEQILTTVFSLTTEQTSKIQELGQANFIMTMYDNCICLQANHLPQVKAMLGPTKDVITRETDTY